ncbi:MAG: sigma-54-dependent Fis family transcriptional regulator [Kofleriaceae bacterium]|nr:sigma-54-dependent Fis family transcriptional regulator [Kofleriaceae bacterium]MCB9575301.1 sigma-54-dependent Fis family transcriptional regulator [Kofleriaceae bacterium]
MARVLVVDDEKGLRSFLAGCLTTEGHKVDDAASGEDALVRLRAQAYDLMITDLKMPGMDGLALLEAALAEQPDLQAILLTAHGSVESAVKAMKLGAFDYLQKPISGPAEVRLLAARALERRALLALREQARRDDGPPRLSWGDPAMTAVVAQLERVAATDATVLLLGESGVGKEVAARTIHARSGRADGPFVAINCATLSEQLLESELFGHERGAFTGATERKRGRIELADGGTFFLDEVGELRPPVQARLLRVLQERTFVRVGGTRSIEVDVRWIAATNRDLRSRLGDGFREDLYHRLAVFPLRLPPLRERKGDILPLAEAMLPRIAGHLGRRAPGLDDDAKARLAAASWPGNVRELGNVLERAVILCDGDVLRAEHLLIDSAEAAPGSVLGGGSGSSADGLTMEQIERRAIEEALAAVGGNRRQAAERLGIGLRTLYDKLRRYGI